MATQPVTRRSTNARDGIPEDIQRPGSLERVSGFEPVGDHVVYVERGSFLAQLEGTRRRGSSYEDRRVEVEGPYDFAPSFQIKSDYHRDALLLWQAANQANPAGVEVKDEESALLAFLAYLNQPTDKINFRKKPDGKEALSAQQKAWLRDEVRTAVLLEFDVITQGANIHTVTGEPTLIGAYNWAIQGLSDSGRIQILSDKLPVPAIVQLLRAGEDVSIAVDFAGQDSDYITELRTLYQTYPAIQGMIEDVAGFLAAEASSAEALESGFFREYGFDVLGWLKDPSQQPPPQILTSSPYSQSLILVTQLAELMVLLENGWTIDDLISLMQKQIARQEQEGGTTGHSQGIMAALVTARGKSGEEFSQDIKSATYELFWQGIFMQEADPHHDYNINLTPAAGEQKFFENNKNISRAVFGAVQGGVTPMLGIRTARPLMEGRILAYLERFNSTLPAEAVALESSDRSLVNSEGMLVFSGKRERLMEFAEFLNKAAEKEKKDWEAHKPSQSELPLEFSGSFLAASAAFHSRAMRGSNERLVAKVRGAIDSGRIVDIYDPSALQVSVWDIETGQDLRQLADSQAVLERTCAIQSVHPTNWPVATRPMRGASYVLHFGPGTNIGKVTGRNLRGTGTAVLMVPLVSDRKLLLGTDPRALPQGSDYARFAPSVATLPDGTEIIYNRFFQIFGRNPISGGGMTPTTTDPEIIVAVIDAARAGIPLATIRESYAFARIPDEVLEGFVQAFGPASGAKWADKPDLAAVDFDWWEDSENLQTALAGIATTGNGYIVELAGGGQPTEAIVRFRLNLTMRMLKPGETIWFNLLWMAPDFKFQEELIMRLREQGYPIEGAVISAGNPKPEEVIPFYERLRASGIEFIAVKPGTDAQIENYLKLAEELAKKHPGWPLRMQIEMGMAGGHRGFVGDEFLLKHYDAIRQHDNIVLELFGGMRSPQDAWAYLSGEWSVKYDGIKRPFDGIGYGTRLMATAEARTHPDVKEGLVATEGTEQWLRSHHREGAGGVLETTSGMNAPLHLAKTTLTMLLNRIDKWSAEGTLETPEHQAIIAFAIYGTQKELLLTGEMARVPERFVSAKIDGTFWNFEEDFYAWFKADKPKLVRPLTDGSLLEVLDRLVAAMTNPLPDYNPFKFYDVSFTKRVYDWMCYVENRVGQPDQKRLIQDWKELEHDPEAVLARFREAYGVKAHAMRMNAMDVSELVAITNRPGKPVCYLLAPTADFIKILKSDALYYSHYKDRQATEWEPGPKAVQGITRANEPTLEIFEDTRRYVVAKFKEENPGVPIPAVADLAPRPLGLNPDLDIPEGVEVRQEGDYQVATITGANVDRRAWFYFLYSQGRGPVRFMLESGRIVCDKTLKNNYIKNLFEPAQGLTVRWRLNERGQFTEVALVDKSKIAPGTTYTPVQLLLGDPLGVGGEHPADMSLVFNHERPALVGRNLQARRVPLAMAYRFSPQQLSPVHEIMEGRTQRIGDFYDQVLFDGHATTVSDASQEIRASYRLTREDVYRYMRTTGHEIKAVRAKIEALIPSEGLALTTALRIVSYDNAQQGRKIAVEGVITDAQGRALDLGVLPINIFFKVAWEPLIASVFPPEVTGNIFNLLHFNNSFAHIPSGVAVKSTFFIQGDFSKSPVAARKMREQSVASFQVTDRVHRDHLAQFAPGGSLQDSSDLQGKKYLLEPKKTYRAEIATTELIERQKLGKKLRTYDTTVRVVDPKSGKLIVVLTYQTDKNPKITDNPLLWLITNKKFAVTEPAKPEGALVAKDDFAAPADMASYAEASDDLNPIHRDRWLIKAMVDDPRVDEPIVHGMWTAANAEVALRQYLGDRRHQLVAFEPAFAKMVKRSAQVTTEIKLGGTENGLVVYHVVSKVDGGDVLVAKATVRQPTMGYVFTGQGSQKTGMGKDLYNSSPAAKKVMDEANRFCRDTLGFDLLHLMWENPKKYTLADGTIVEHPNGVLDMTQFTQPALVALALAEFAALKEAGAFLDGSALAGHSLGEYAALAATGILSLEDCIVVTYQRGLTMQNAVKRDSEGKSNYAMYVVRPWVKKLDEAGLVALVEGIRARHAGEKNRFGDSVHLEVVNFNVPGSQYSAVGDLELLEELKQALDAMPTCDEAIKVEGGKRTETEVYQIIKGIDVPFHSQVLAGGIPIFRKKLQATFKGDLPADKVQMLVGHYVPNLVAKPFSLERSYVELVYAKTSSPVLKKLLETGNWARVSANPGQLARILLIELLAYQFANPVLWIDTMRVMFGQNGMDLERIVELGTGGVLKGMIEGAAKRDIKPARKNFEVLDFEGDSARVFWRAGLGPTVELRKVAPRVVAQTPRALEAPKASSDPKPTAPAAPPVAPVAASVAQPVATSAAQAAGPLGELAADKAALVAIKVIVANVLQKPVSEIDVAKSYKTLAGDSGKENQIEAAIKAEFGLDKAGMKEWPLSELAKQVSQYRDIGATIAGALNQLVTDHLSSAKISVQVLRDHLTGERMLPPTHVPAALAFIVGYAAQNKPSEGDKAKKLAWANTAVDAYGREIGSTIPSKVAVASAGAIAMPMQVAGIAAAPANVPELDATKLTELALRVTVAVIMGKTLAEVPASSSLKDLKPDSGKMNELVPAISAEFGYKKDGADSKPLAELAKEIAGYKGGDANGFLHNRINQFITDHLQGAQVSRQELFNYLTQKRNFPASQAMGFLSFLALGSASKLSSMPSGLKDKAAALAWVDEAIKVYGAEVGVDLSPPAAQAAGVVLGAAVSGAALQELEDRWFKGLDSPFMRFVFDMMEKAGYDPYAGMMPKLENAEAKAAAEELKFYRAEYGEGDALPGRDGKPGTPLAKAMASVFDKARVVSLDDTANEAKFKTTMLAHDLRRGAFDLHDPKHTRDLMLLTTQVVNLATETSLAMLRAAYVTARRDAEALETSRGEAATAEVARLRGIADYLEKVYKIAGQVVGTQATYLNLDDFQMLAPAEEMEPDSAGRPILKFVPRPGMDSAAAWLDNVFGHVVLHGKPYPIIVVEKNDDDVLRTVDDPETTSIYRQKAEELLGGRRSFAGEVYLITGAQVEANGMTNMGAEIAKIIWQGGGTVIFTSHFFTAGSVDNLADPYNPYLKRMIDLFHKSAGRGAKGIAMPANAASYRDQEAIINHIYDDMGLKLDGVMPFAAMNPLARFDQWMPNQARFEFGRRVMQVGTMGLISALARKLESLPQGGAKRPTVVLPDSINPNTMEGNFVYGSEKGAGHAFANAVRAEWDRWGKRFRFVELEMGLIVTPLTAAISAVAHAIEEKYGVRLFESHEMAKLICALLDAEVSKNADATHQALRVVLSGALHHLVENPEDADKRRFFPQIYADLMQTVAEKMADKVILKEFKQEWDVIMGQAKLTEAKVAPVVDWSKVYGLPELASDEDLGLLSELDHLDPLRLIVITSYAYVGPWGDAEIRRDVGINGDLSMASVIKAASLYIKGADGKANLITRNAVRAKWEYQGPEDATLKLKPGDLLSDQEVASKLKSAVLKGMGIRRANPAILGFDPANLEIYAPKILRGEAKVAAADQPDAQATQEVDGDRARTLQANGEPVLTLKDGTKLYVPKLLHLRRFVQGQVPDGWDAKRYGLADDVIKSVDRVTLYTLVAMLNAILKSGVSPVQIFMEISRSELGNHLGSGLGGGMSLHEMFVLFHIGKIISKDLLAKMLANDVSQGSSDQEIAGGTRGGKSTTAACATAIMSVHSVAGELGHKRGIRFAWAGGTDGLSPSGVVTFGEYGHNATGDTEELLAQGRNPRGMSPGNDGDRSGFMESEGAAVFGLCDQALAEELGMPIFAGVAFTDSASGGHGTSITAPDTGLAHIAATDPAGDPAHKRPRYRVTDLEYRRQQIATAAVERDAQLTAAFELQQQTDVLAARIQSGHLRGQALARARVQLTEQREHVTAMVDDAHIMFESMRHYWGHDFYKEYASLSPLEGALNVFGLSVADIGLIVQHGTATPANDKNEALTYNGILEAAIQSTIKDKLIRTMAGVLDDDYERLARVIGLIEAGVQDLGGLFAAIDGIMCEKRWKANQRQELREQLIDEIIVELTFQAVVENAKAVDGHPKGPAGGVQMISAIQSFEDGALPGNRAMRALDTKIQELGGSRLIYSDRNLWRDRRVQAMLRVALIGTFGFGRTTAGAALTHPAFNLRAMTQPRRDAYRIKYGGASENVTNTGIKLLTGEELLFKRHAGLPILENSAELHANLHAGTRVVKNPDGTFKYHVPTRPLPMVPLVVQTGGMLRPPVIPPAVARPMGMQPGTGPRLGSALFRPAPTFSGPLAVASLLKPILH